MSLSRLSIENIKSNDKHDWRQRSKRCYVLGKAGKGTLRRLYTCTVWRKQCDTVGRT